MIPIHILSVAAGGALGSVCRHLISVAALKLLGGSFPWGTLAVNATGSFAMGAFIAYLTRFGGDVALRLAVATGFLGGFTTYSTFSLEVVVLYERGQPALAAAYIAASILLSLAGIAAGLSLVRTIT
ncbi:MAG TPA: fluoride efflux transporter CrcB [Methylomirabilota bacterium]|nr:fluoride efflux transporter CrcB [Methylomirabilota bacterium]